MDSLTVLTPDAIKDLCDQDQEIIFIYAQAAGRIKRIRTNLFVAALEVILLISYLNHAWTGIESAPFLPQIKLVADWVMWIVIPVMVVVLLIHPFKAWELPAYCRGNKKVIEHFKEKRQIDIRKLTEKQIWKGLFEVDKPFLS